jgi:Spy/CpxP family protein refolding chaperone
MKLHAILLGAALLAIPGLAKAQPDAGNGATANNPPNRPPGGGGGNRGGWNLTPEQRQQLQTQIQQVRDQSIRRELTQAGFTDVTIQDAVVAFAKVQDEARQPLQEKWRQIAQALRGDTFTETQLMSQLNSFRAAVDDEKARSAKALAALDAKISFSKKPRLDALLMTMGLTGHEGALVNNGGRVGGRGNGRGGIGGFGNGGGLGGQNGGVTIPNVPRNPAVIGPNGGFNF